MSYTAEAADAATNHNQKESHTMTRETTPGNRRNTATKSMQRNAHPQVEYTDDQRDAATVAMLDDPAGYADSLSEQAAASSMAPAGLDHYTTAEYIQCAAVIDALAARLADRFNRPKVTADTYAQAMSQAGVPQRVALDLWTRDRVLQMHDHSRTQTVDMNTGEVRTIKTYHRRWNDTDAIAGSITVGEVTYMLCDDHDHTDATGEYMVHLIAAPHHETMFYDMNGKRYPYLGQYVAREYAKRPGAGNQRTFTATVRILAQLSPATAIAYAVAWHDAKQAAYRMAEIEAEAARIDDHHQDDDDDDTPRPEPKPSPTRLAHADAMRIEAE